MKRKVVYKGNEYKSISEFAREVGIDEGKVRRGIMKGMSVEEIVADDCGRSIEYNGVKYRSLNKLAKAVGINHNTLNKRINTGMRLNEAINTPVGKNKKYTKIEYNGKEYDNVSELAYEVGVPVTTLYNRLKGGMEIQEAVQTEIRAIGAKKIEYNGKTYSSIKQLAESVGMNYSTLICRIKDWGDVKKAVETPLGDRRIPKRVIYKGKEYGSIQQLAKEYNVVPATILNRLNKGISLEEAVEPTKGINYIRKNLVYKGKIYGSINEVVREHEISYELLLSRLKRGMSLEDALDTPVRRRGK